MNIEELLRTDVAAVAELWKVAELTRPWNDPVADFERAIDGPSSTVLGFRANQEIVGTIMVGHDGHRGWVYYLAVSPELRGRGLGAQLMSCAEQWLRDRGVVKLQLMVRSDNQRVVTFYEHRGYEASDVIVMARWLSGDSADET